MTIFHKIIKWIHKPSLPRRMEAISISCYTARKRCLKRIDSDGYIMYCSRACTLFIKHYFCLSYIHRDDFDSTAIRVMISEMARLMCEVECYDTSIEMYKILLPECQNKCGKRHPSTAAIYMDIATLFWKQKKYLKALDCYEKALHIYKRNYGSKHHKVAMCYEWASRCMCCVEMYRKAASYGEKAVKSYTAVYGELNENVKNCYESLTFAYSIIGNMKRAEYCAAKKQQLSVALEEYDGLSLEF